MPFEGPLPSGVPDEVAPPDRLAAEVVAATRKMEALLERNGWCQGETVDFKTGAMCFYGAAMTACDLGNHRARSLQERVYRQIEYEAERIIKTTIPLWNDVPGRTVSEVIGLIRRIRAAYER